MSNLVYQNYNNRCQGWVNPSNLLFGTPEIQTFSSYQSPAGSTTLVAITGKNFYSYSIVRFGTFSPTVYFINSNLIEFYVPPTLNSGIFAVQIFNGSLGSNIINYTIDNASGYWLLNSSGIISNTNNSGINVSWLSRGSPITVNAATYIILNTDNWIICNHSGTVTITLPTGTQYTGRELMIKTITNNSVLSNSSIVKPIGTNTPGNTILTGTAGKWATLVYDGASWIIMQSN